MGTDFSKDKAFEGWRIGIRRHSNNAGIGEIRPRSLIPTPPAALSNIKKPKLRSSKQFVHTAQGLAKSSPSYGTWIWK